jgi:hypothetical protein
MPFREQLVKFRKNCDRLMRATVMTRKMHALGGIWHADRTGSALVWPLHDFHGVFYMAPFVGLFDLTVVLASPRILGRMSDRRGAVPFKHLSSDGVDLDLGNHDPLLVSLN